MCGIAGTNAEGWINEAVEHQKMRGPDNQQIISRNGWSFGHNRLSIIDIEGGNQPMFIKDHMMVFNGEWYDFKDYYPTQTSDSFALFNHLCNGGSINDVNGMFAISFHDNIEKKLHLWVDRFGQKPLYYYHSGSEFYFASTPAALYFIKDKWELDREALQSYWLLGSVMGSDGLFKGIKKLCASEHLIYDELTNKVTIERYWEPQFKEEKDIEGMVLESIRKVKVSDVPIHIFLSGGIDSTLVASQFEGGKAVHLDGPEWQYAQFVADKFGIGLTIIDPEAVDTEEALMDYSFQCGEPTMAGIIPYMVAREVSQIGKVAISANGADELFFGYDRTHDTISEKQLRHTFRDIRLPDQDPPYPFYSHMKGCMAEGRMWELGGYVQFDLNKTLDFASMCHGLEVRNPFLDHNLVEVALSIPENIHRQRGNKTILKNILRKMGFKDQFLDRPKQGFSLFKKPKGLEDCMSLAWDWVNKEGYLDIKGKELSGRDEKYLKMSALGFYYWYKTWKHKI